MCTYVHAIIINIFFFKRTTYYKMCHKNTHIGLLYYCVKKYPRNIFQTKRMYSKNFMFVHGTNNLYCIVCVWCMFAWWVGALGI